MGFVTALRRIIEDYGIIFHSWPRTCLICRTINPVHRSVFLVHHLIRPRVIDGAGIAFPSVAPAFIPRVLRGSCYSISCQRYCFCLYGKGHVGSFYSQNATLCYALYIFLILSVSRVVINCYALNCNLWTSYGILKWKACLRIDLAWCIHILTIPFLHFVSDLKPN